MGRAVKDEPQAAMPDMVPGELGELLEEIENEAVPERLLELAVRLQAALQTSRKAKEKKRALVEG